MIMLSVPQMDKKVIAGLGFLCRLDEVGGVAFGHKFWLLPLKPLPNAAPVKLKERLFNLICALVVVRVG
jgi:hypothetical protein